MNNLEHVPAQTGGWYKVERASWFCLQCVNTLPLEYQRDILITFETDKINVCCEKCGKVSN